MNDTESFECAFVATSYFLGLREDVLAGIGGGGDGATALLRALGASDRAARAQALSRALRPVVEALDARKLG